MYLYAKAGRRGSASQIRVLWLRFWRVCQARVGAVANDGGDWIGVGRQGCVWCVGSLPEASGRDAPSLLFQRRQRSRRWWQGCERRLPGTQRTTVMSGLHAHTSHRCHCTDGEVVRKGKRCRLAGRGAEGCCHDLIQYGKVAEKVIFPAVFLKSQETKETKFPVILRKRGKYHRP